MSRGWRWFAVVAAGLIVLAVQPATPENWSSAVAFDAAWRLLAIFVAAIVGLVLEPLPGGAVVLLALIAAIVCGALSTSEALGGFVDPTVWLVLSAFWISRAFIQTGLAKRIALGFVRLLGGNSLGLGYALAGADAVLAGMIPSNAARVGGVMLPVARSISEVYRSYPGATSGLLGGYLMVSLYQADVMACSLYITGQASNVLAASQAKAISNGAVVIDYATWFVRASVPALACLAIIPWLVFRFHRPAIVHTPKAAEFATKELEILGPLKPVELFLAIMFCGVCLLWILLDHRQTAVVALSGVGVLLLTGVLSWDELTQESKAWDVFIWYGGLVQLGKMLQQQGLMERFAAAVMQALAGWSGMTLFVAALLVYFFSHYGFASITTHILSLFAAFAKVLIAGGLPAPLVLTALPLMTNFSAGLTHYGTTPGPIIYGLGYVSQRRWWGVGLAAALINLAVWLTIGLAWWKFLGLW